MSKEKQRLVLYYIMLILVIFSLLLGFHLIRKNKQKVSIEPVMADKKVSDTLEIKESQTVDQDLPLDSDIALELLEKVSVFNNYKAGSYYGYFYNQDYMDISMISDDAKVIIGITQNENFANDFLNATYDAVAPDGTPLDVIILSKEEIQEGINSFFGPNTSYTDTDLIDGSDYCGFSKFKFDNTRNVYMSDPITCSGFPKPYVDSKLMRVHQSGDKIELYVKIAYVKYETTNSEEVVQYIYKNKADLQYLEKHMLLSDNSYDINNILDKLDTFKFTFTLNSNNYYYFTKVEKI